MPFEPRRSSRKIQVLPLSVSFQQLCVGDEGDTDSEDSDYVPPDDDDLASDDSGDEESGSENPVDTDESEEQES
jgi:hypothetical protein